jgi:hypothetical protein
MQFSKMSSQGSFQAQSQSLNFDIDTRLNPYFLPAPSYLPLPILYVLGYRKTAAPDVGNLVVAITGLVSTFLGLFTITSLFHYSAVLQSVNPPVLIGSLVSC